MTSHFHLNRVKKSYLITGGAGFIGSHVAERLLGSGNSVVAIDNLSTGSIENIKHLLDKKEFQFVRADMNDGVVMDRLGAEAECIIHLAAAVGVKLIVEHPVHTIQTNITGTEVVLKVAMRYKCPVLIASTSEVYGKGHKIPFAEDDDVLLGPTCRSRWAYAASKMVDEFLALAYYREYGLPCVVARFFNTIGPRQTGQYGMVVPSFVRQALKNEPLTVYGDGQQSRCFCDVRDVADAVLRLLECEKAYGKVFNIGSQSEISITELAETIIHQTNSQSSIQYVSYEDAYTPGFEDMRQRVPNTTRIRELIGWEPTFSLNDTLEAIVNHEESTFPITRNLIPL